VLEAFEEYWDADLAGGSAQDLKDAIWDINMQCVAHIQPQVSMRLSLDIVACG
jgi:hypothetical protein